MINKATGNAMIRSIRILICLTALVIAGLRTTPAPADANDGELFGYRLGDRYVVGPDTSAHVIGLAGHDALRVVAAQAVTPDDVSEVQILCTVGSCRIGAISGIIKPVSQQAAIETADRYVRLLRNLYRDWAASEDPNSQIVTLRKSPYVIQVMRFQMPLEVRVNLKFDRDSSARKSWVSVLARESESYQKAARERLVEESATQGL
jgi:hypothetical protein